MTVSGKKGFCCHISCQTSKLPKTVILSAMDQGAPPFERDALDNVIVNYSFYDRWNLRPSMISSEINSSEEGYSLIPNPFVQGEVIVSVIYQDGTISSAGLLTTAPINGPEL